MKINTTFCRKPAVMSFSSGFFLSLLYGLSCYAYRTLYVSNLLEFYSGSAIHVRVMLIEYAMSAMGLVIGAQLIGAKWWAGGVALLANSLLLPWVAVLLSEDVYMAPDFGILFFLPFWLALRLFAFQLAGLAVSFSYNRHRLLQSRP